MGKKNHVNEPEDDNSEIPNWLKKKNNHKFDNLFK